jgi:hypothetical protein
MAGILKVDTIQNANADNIITQTNSTTLTIGTSGDTVTLAAGATSSGFGATYNGAVNWDTTPKTTTVTAVSGVGYFINTTSGAVTVNLPAGSAGAIVALADYAATWNTNNVTVNANGTQKIGGVASSPATLSTQGQSVTFIYVDSTEGWINVGDATPIQGNPFIVATGGTILTCGDFKTHVFTGPGTFTVTCAGSPGGSNSVEYLVVAGGGGGGSDRGGAGGAGGYRQNYPSPTTAGLPVTAQGYPITVGGGGSNGVYAVSVGGSGVNSIFSTITSTGGGGGGSGGNPPVGAGNNGGSGGGGSNTSPNASGTGNTPPVSPPQGNNGGTGTPVGNRGGGGGGAAAVGSNAGPTGGPGGAGSPIATTFFGPTAPSYGTPGPAPGRYFAGGGGGSTASTGTAGTGGSGGGGAGSAGDGDQKATAGTANTGGGGGGGTGGGCNTGNSGGSGVVVIRYKFQ